MVKKYLGTKLEDASGNDAFGGSENALETNPAAPLQGWRAVLFNPETGKAENPDSITNEDFLLDYRSGDSLPEGWDLFNAGPGYAELDLDGFRFDVPQVPDDAESAEPYGKMFINAGDGPSVGRLSNYTDLEFGCKFKVSSVTDIVDGKIAIMSMMVMDGGPPKPYVKISLVRVGGIFRIKAVISVLMYVEEPGEFVENPDYLADTGFFGPSITAADTEYEVRCRFTRQNTEVAPSSISVYFGGTWSEPAHATMGIDGDGRAYLTAGQTDFKFYNPEVTGPEDAAFQVLITDMYYKNFTTTALTYPSGFIPNGRKTYLGGVLTAVGPAIDVVYKEDYYENPEGGGPLYKMGASWYYKVSKKSPEVIVLPHIELVEGEDEEAGISFEDSFEEGDTYTIVFPYYPFGDGRNLLYWATDGLGQAYSDSGNYMRLFPGDWIKVQCVKTEVFSEMRLTLIIIAAGNLAPIPYESLLNNYEYDQKIGYTASFTAEANVGDGGPDVTVSPQNCNFYVRENSGGMDISFYMDAPGYFGTAYLDIINVEGAGYVAFGSGIDKVIGADLITTDVGDKFRVSITAGPAGVLAIVVPMQ